ncbi:MAG: PadR family transcriptional regulator [Candidatus Omnitrophota bacterium]|nr:PadR family transcriptional regulator [Candidatus Omnitrophota bacterium]
MIEHELILLGLLKESPKHGYEIKKKIKDIFSLFAGVDLKSIYYPLRILEKKNLVTKKISKAGRRPQRLVYALTPKGETRFKELLTQSLLNFKRPQFSLDLSLYFLNYMKPDIVKRRLRARTQVLEGLSRGLRQMIGSLKKQRSAALAYILEHNLQMVETESKFLTRLIKTI